MIKSSLVPPRRERPASKNGQMTQKEQYLAAGFKLLPSGHINNHTWTKYIGRAGSSKDSTWIKDPKNRRRGHHKCCGSKRDYYHKKDCSYIKQLYSDDYSDLKEKHAD